MRIRTIKPEFYLHEGLAELPALTRLLFTGLWGLADIAGRLEDRPRRIKPQVLPHDDCDVDAALQSLADAGFIVRYEVEGLKLIEVINFKKHQRIQGDESKKQSIYPAPPAQTGKNTQVTPTQQVSNAQEYFSNGQVTDKNTGKGKGKEKERSISPLSPPSGGGEDGKPTHASTPQPTPVAAPVSTESEPSPQQRTSPSEGSPKSEADTVRKRTRQVTPTAEDLTQSLPIPQQINSPAFRETWRKWLEIRLRGTRPKRPWEAFFADQLDWLASSEIGTEPLAIASLNQSIRNGYTGLFTPKTKPDSAPRNPALPPRRAAWA